MLWGHIMKLLLGRGQHTGGFSLIPLRIGLGAIFRLTAELELDEEEKRLITRYQLSKVALVVSNPADDLKRAFRPALMLAFFAFALIMTFGWLGRLPEPTLLLVAVPTSLGILMSMTGAYFVLLREQITISDLVYGGRTFYCDSVVELIQKEAYLERISEYLRQVLESAKNWQDREVIDIQPLDRTAAKQAVLAGV